MKIRPKSPIGLFQIAVVVTLAATGWFSFVHFDDARRSFESAQQELGRSVSLANQIALLRQKPDRAAVQSRSEQALAEAIEKSAAAAGVAREQVARVEPQQPRRSGDSDYLEHATVVQLDGITLGQLAGALAALRSTSGLEQLRVSTLRIAAPYQAAASQGAEPWNVELTLSYFVYSPKTAAPRRS